jgi:RimJ/RimL family protein N-acetyltransferase
MMLQSRLLKGNTVRLTIIRETDLPVLSRWYENEEFLRLLDAIPAMPQAERHFKKWLDNDPGKNEFLFMIRTADSDELVGFAKLDGILWNHRNAWITLAIGDRKHWGKGYGKESLQLLLGYAFRELNLHRLQLTVFSYNTRAIRLYESLGFQKEGTYRKFLLRDGQAFDMHLYGLLREEWE